MIKLYQFHSAFGLPNPSPFCMKVETFLKMAGITYKNVYKANPAIGPKGKFPFIEFENGERLGDSNFILETLTEQYNVTIDAHLTPQQKAEGYAIQRMLEDHLYWCAVHNRWLIPENWAVIKQEFFSGLPPVIKSIIPALAQRGLKNRLKKQGIGLHTAVEIDAMGVQDVKSLADYLNDKPYLLGDKISSYDAIVHGFIANMIAVPIEDGINTYAQNQQNLVAYHQRMMERFYKS